MTTATMPPVNLDPGSAEKRSFTDVYRVKSASYEQASEVYAARAGGARPLQLTIEWEALTFRFADNPTVNPILRRSVNVTDKNGAPMTWGDPKNPEPTSEDSFPIQVSKHFAKCGVTLGTDPHVLDGKVFRCERTTLRAGKTELQTLIPIERMADDFSVPESEIRIVTGRSEQGQAGNPATGAAVPTGPSKDEAYKAVAQALNGQNKTSLVNVALGATTNPDVLAEVAAGAPAIAVLETLGSFAADGTFTAA